MRQQVYIQQHFRRGNAPSRRAFELGACRASWLVRRLGSPCVRSELFYEPCLFQDFIGGVARFNHLIDRDAAIGYRAEPNIMIATPMPLEVAARF
jgi:hypothetical protein